MPKCERIRIDYMPGTAALEALDLAAGMFPDTRPQALLDKLVITAVSALAHKHWHAPYLCGKDRDKWKLPDDLHRESGD
jgi:hypothetical protein